MAQTGFTPIQIYSSSTASTAPAAGNLTNSTLGSELAINITDGKLFYKDNANAVQVIGWKVVPTTAGGTGLTSYAQGDLIYYDAGTTFAKLAKNTSATRYLSNTGSSNNPAWAQVDLTNGVTGDLPFSNLAQGSALSVLGVTGNATADVASIAAGTDHQVLRRSGTSLAFGAIALNQSAAVTGTLPVGNGGTGITTTPTNGQIPIGNGTNYTAATLTAGGGIGITNGAGSVTIATSSPTFSAYGNAAQTITTDVFTKVVLNAEDYDTNNNFDSTTNYRFTPTVAGYYQLNLKLSVATTSTLTLVIGEFRKNGSGANYGRGLQNGFSVGTFGIFNTTTIMYFDGSSDYCEIWIYLSGAGTLTTSSNDKNTTFFQGSMIRAA